MEVIDLSPEDMRRKGRRTKSNGTRPKDSTHLPLSDPLWGQVEEIMEMRKQVRKGHP